MCIGVCVDLVLFWSVGFFYVCLGFKRLFVLLGLVRCGFGV